MGEISSSNCLIYVGHELTVRDQEHVPNANSARILRVPKPLRDSNESFYSPHFVSIGPFHHDNENLKAMETSKSEAVRRMQMRMQRNQPDASIKSIVEEVIVLKDKAIREFYGEPLSQFSSLQLAWMVTRDACFVYEFVLNYVKTGKGAKKLYKREVTEFKWSYDAVFDVGFQNPVREKIMDDILLFENQIPLFILKDLQIHKLNCLMKLLIDNAVRHKIFTWSVTRCYSEYCHVLEVVYHGMIGPNATELSHRGAEQLPSSSRLQICVKKGFKPMKAICRRWCKLCLHFPRGKARSMPSSPHNRKQGRFKKAFDSMKANCRNWCNKYLCSPSSNRSRSKKIKLELLTLPTALELTHKGVKIHPVLAGDPKRNKIIPAIRWIRFDDKTSTLYLPQIKITLQSDYVLRNIIAMEVSTKWSYSQVRPMTQLAMFLDELIDREEDVDVLRKAGVIDNFLGSNQQVVDLFNSLTNGIRLSKGCKVIDEARTRLHNYTKRKYKILWSEFVNAYFSKPWLVAGSMAATLLLLMTVAQVFCLFFTCNHLSS